MIKKRYKCNKCGKEYDITHQDLFVSFVPMCDSPFPLRAAGICGGRLVEIKKT